MVRFDFVVRFGFVDFVVRFGFAFLVRVVVVCFFSPSVASFVSGFLSGGNGGGVIFSRGFKAAVASCSVIIPVSTAISAVLLSNTSSIKVSVFAALFAASSSAANTRAFLFLGFIINFPVIYAARAGLEPATRWLTATCSTN